MNRIETWCMAKGWGKGLFNRFPLTGGWLLGLVFLVTLPVTLPIAMTQHQRMLKRMRAVAAQFACVKCGATLGERALQLGDARWGEFMRQHHDASASWRVRIVRDLHAVCATCAAEHTYDEKREAFLLRGRDTKIYL